MTVWILAGALAAAVAVVVALLIQLRRSHSRALATDAIIASGREEIRRVVREETDAHSEEIRRTLRRERADAISRLAAEERRLSEERRTAVLERERRAAESLAGGIRDAEVKLTDRLRAFTDDLERAERHLEAQLRRLEQRQAQAIAEVEHRVEVEAAELGSTADEQRKNVLRLRDELERAAGSAVAEALDELETQATERRRAIEEITERLRARETAIAEGIERAESDARARLELTLVEFERRQAERLERVTEREIERHAQMAALSYDERMREIREEAAAQLARELERAVAMLSREELARRLDEVS